MLARTSSKTANAASRSTLGNVSKRFASTEATSTTTATNAAARPVNPYSIKNLSRKDQIIACIVFSCAGSAALWIVRPSIRAISNSGVFGEFPPDAGFINGPWSYRFLYIMIMWPSYTVMLYTIGCIFQRREFFAYFVCKMWGRFLPKPATQKLKQVLGAPTS